MQADLLDIDYLRLSLEDDDVASGDSVESVSIMSQRACIKEYVSRNPDVPQFLTEFVDDGYSGTSMERPSMKRVLQLVTMGRVRTIIVRDLSRFARNYLEAGHYLEFVFPSYNVRFISINDNYDSAKIPYGDSAAFQLAIQNLLNDLYSKDISRKIKSAVNIKKMSGEYCYGQAPYGYKKGDKKNTIVVDDEAACVVRKIFSWAKQGITITNIARKLNEEKILTPSVYLAEIRGKYQTRTYWTFNSVKNIIENRIYTGDTEPYKSHVVKIGSNRVKMIPEEERIIIPNTHEAIISRETFYLARTVIKSNKKTKTNKPRNVLSGYLVCGCCGNKLVKGRTTNKSWLCASARYTDDMDCGKIRLNEERMKESLLKAIQTQCSLADLKVETNKVQKKQTIAEVDNYSWELKAASRKLSETSKRLMDMLEEYYAGNLTKEEFLAQKKNLKAEEEELKARVTDLEQKISDLKSEMLQKRNEEYVDTDVSKHKNVTELDELLVRELVKEIVIYPGDAIQINWNFKNQLDMAK